MPLHWKIFIVGLVAVATTYYAITPHLAGPVDGGIRLAMAIGSCIPAAAITLIGAGIGKLTRFGTAAGLYSGGALAIAFVGLGAIAALGA